MAKLGTFIIMILLFAGVACSKERTVQTSSEVKEKTSQSTTVAEAPAPQPQEDRNTQVETHKSTSKTLSADPSGSVQVEREKQSSTTVSPAEDGGADTGTVRSERHSQLPKQTHFLVRRAGNRCPKLRQVVACSGLSLSQAAVKEV
jgi:hypothetical protein